MITYDIHYSDLKPELQEELARLNGYESAAEYIAETNSDIMPFGELIMYRKGEEPEEAPEASKPITFPQL